MLEVGGTFERFRIDSVLGQGGMGKVYRAFDTRLERPVALKVLLLDATMSASMRAEAAARMLSEARSAAAVEHPHKVSVYDVGQSGEMPYIAMEFIPGVTLRAYVGQREPLWTRKLAWLLSVASALDAAHVAGIVHRDVKPENVMVRDDGIVKVLDFGIARRHVGDEAREVTTGEGRVIGTPAYMAPEQIAGREIDGRTDQFAWGITAYELLAGVLPWSAKSGSLSHVAGILTEAPTPLRARVPDLPRVVDDVVMRSLAKNPAERYPRIGAIIDALDPLADRRVGPTTRERLSPVPSRGASGRISGAPSPSAPPPRAMPEPPPPRGMASSAPPSPSVPPTPSTSPVARSIGPAAAASIVPPIAATESVITGTRGLSSTEPLSFAVDAEARFARFPPAFRLKGMFFSRLLGLGARHAEAVKPKLLEPPRTGKYLPFGDYPQVDFSRIAHAVALGLHPNVPVPEAMRRFARTDFATFAASAMGRVTLALMGDAATAILKMPDTYAAVMKGGSVTARTISPGVYELGFHDFYGWVDCYPLGQVEGMVRHFGLECRVDARIEGALHAVYRIHVFSLATNLTPHRGPCSNDPRE